MGDSDMKLDPTEAYFVTDGIKRKTWNVYTWRHIELNKKELNHT